MAAIIDTHAHLCDPVFDPDRPAVLERALAAGVSAVVCVGEDLEDARRNLELSARHPMLRPAAGLYPTHLDLSLAARMRQLIRECRDSLAAIGEVGLDYWMVREAAGREVQREIFRGFIELGKELDLPLNVHSRSAGRHAVAFLLECGATRVQMHAFDGKASSALPAVEAGFFFSVPPSVVRSEQKRRLVAKLPLSALLVETDSPVLGPSPEARNEPANALVALQAVAEVKGLAVEEVMEAIEANTARLYGRSLS